MPSKVIGIIGGMGPYAALDVNQKIYENTIANKDKNHLDVVCLSFCQEMPDRTEFLLGKSTINPALILFEKIKRYDLAAIGIACNTFHAAPIFDVFKSKMKAKNKELDILHLPTEVKKAALNKFKHGTIGVLCTLGTYQSNIYQNVFKDSPIHLKFPDKAGRKAIHEVLYHEEWGIKQNGKLSDKAKNIIEAEMAKFSNIDAILLACTELPLVIKNIHSEHKFLDTNLILARALIQKTAPLKLKDDL